DKMVSSRATFLSLNPPAEQKADIDYLVASADLKAWDEKGSDDGPNRAARNKAVMAMENYFNANKGNPSASGYAVQAAYHAAKALKVGRDPKAVDWCKNTIQEFEKFRSSHKEPLGTIQADMAAECAYNGIEERIRGEWDYDTGHHRYEGVIDQVKKKF